MNRPRALAFLLLFLLPVATVYPQLHYRAARAFNDFGIKNTRYLTPFDANGDGNIDLAVGNWSLNCELYLNDGHGGFTGREEFNQFGSCNTRPLVSFDADGDGDLDVAIGNRDGDGEYNQLYFNDGAGDFSGIMEFNALGIRNSCSMAAFDADGDGDADIAVGNWGYLNELYLNDGMGHFRGRNEFDAFGPHHSLAMVPFDADGDGDLDLAVGNEFNEPNELYWNDGAGNFTGIQEFNACGPRCTYGMIAFDADGDGDMDIAATNIEDEPNELYLNQGNGTFEGREEFNAFGPHSNNSLVAFDADGDGDLDVALAVGNPEHPNELYLNNGQADFTGFTAFKHFGPLETQAITAFDADQDGHPDIVTGNYLYTSNEIYFYQPEPTVTPRPYPTPSPEPALDPIIEASADPLTGPAPLTVDFDAVLLQGGDIRAYRWDFENDGFWDYASPQSPKATHTYGAVGDYLAVISAIDALGRYAYDFAVIRVEPAANPPLVQARATPASGMAPLEVAFGGDVESARPLAFYLWDYDSDGAIDWGSRQTASSVHIYGGPGLYVSRLTVVDDTGLMASDSVYIQVSPGDSPPQVQAGAEPRSGPIPLEVAFSGVALPPSQTVRYEWDFDGNGDYDWSSSSDATCAHVFAVPGDYHARLRAVDSHGLYGEDTVTIIATSPSQLRVWISVPQDDWTVWGNAVSIRMNTAPGVQTAWVQAQFKETSQTQWIDIGGPLYPPPFSFDCVWDTTALTPGVYNLRAKAADTSGSIVYSEGITVQVTATGAVAEEEIDPQGEHSKRQQTSRYESSRIEIAGGTILDLPYHSLDANATGALISLPGNPRPGKRARSTIGLLSFTRVVLEGIGALQRPAALSIPYLDIDSDGFVDGTGVLENDLTIFGYNPVAGEWQVLPESTVHRAENFVQVRILAAGEYALGATVSLPSHLVLESGDYNGNGISDTAIFRPATGLWAVRDGERSYLGAAGDLPASGDYNGDGTAEKAVFRAGTGLWIIAGVTRCHLGTRGDVAIPGDYSGDGTCDLGIWRAAGGCWTIPGITQTYLGAAQDLAAPADFNGDGRADIGIFRPATGLWAVPGITRKFLGASSDSPVPADYSGDGTAEFAVFRSSAGLWSIAGRSRCYFGQAGDTPAVASYSSNAYDDAAVFRPSSGMWAIRQRTRFYFGGSADIPVSH